MSQPSTLAPEAPVEITIRTGSGTGRTPLSAFDSALMDAGVANFNLITLSSVIPPGARVTLADDLLPGGHGDRLYCVLSAAHAERTGEIVWAGLGWVADPDTGAGLFVEHTAGSEESLLEQIELSLADMVEHRGGGYGPVQSVVASAHCTDRPVCALAIAAYVAVPWGHDGG